MRFEFACAFVAILATAALAMPAEADMAEARRHFLKGDYAAARVEFQRLAQNGDADAQTKLAEMYFIGRGVDKDVAAAVKWYRAAAAGGNATAQVTLGLISVQGGDVDAGAKWLRAAAEQGDVDGMTNLAALYVRGMGVEQNVTTALGWYVKAAERGDPEIQVQVATMYLAGTAGMPDTAKGIEWMTRAADQGFAEAQMQLGTFYAEGHGVDRDPVRAYAWFHRAVMQGEERAAANVAGLAADMTPEQIAAAKRHADAWSLGKP